MLKKLFVIYLKFKFSWAFCILLGKPNLKGRCPNSSNKNIVGKIVTCEDLQQYEAAHNKD